MKKPISIYLCAIASMVLILTACEQVQHENNKQEKVQQVSAQNQSAELMGSDKSIEDRTQIQTQDDTDSIKRRITCNNAVTMISAYRDNRLPLLGKYKQASYTEGIDAGVQRIGGEIIINISEDRSLYSWHIPQADINQIQGPNSSGMRVYPGINDTIVTINLRPSGTYQHKYTYHTLVCFGTTEDTDGNHVNRTDRIFQYFPPCPEQCEHAHAREPEPCL